LTSAASSRPPRSPASRPPSTRCWPTTRLHCQVRGWEDRHCWLPRRPGHEGHGLKGQPEGRCRAAYEEAFL